MTIGMTGDFPSKQQQLYDDFTVIKGIGVTRQQWFRDSFHVHTLEELATLAIHDIEAQLKANRQIVSREQIVRWIAEANRLANVTDHSSSPAASLVNSESGAQERQQADKPRWKPFASFVVEYQTRLVDSQKKEQCTKVHHIETDTCAAWSGIAKEQLCEWIIAKLEAL